MLYGTFCRDNFKFLQGERYLEMSAGHCQEALAEQKKAKPPRASSYALCDTGLLPDS
jgi:hypothetical protein